MGLSTSSQNSGEGGLTLEGLIEEANSTLVKVTEVISQSAQSQVADIIRDLQEKAAATVASISATTQEQVAELSRQSEEAKICVQRREPELQAIQVKMKNAMLECNNKYNDTLEKLRSDRTIIHTEAKQFQLDIQRMVQNCLSSNTPIDCFRKSLSELTSKVNVLLKKFEALVRREAEVRAKTARQFFDCDKKVLETTNKDVKRILEEIKKCAQKEQKKS